MIVDNVNTANGVDLDDIDDVDVAVIAATQAVADMLPLLTAYVVKCCRQVHSQGCCGEFGVVVAEFVVEVFAQTSAAAEHAVMLRWC